MPNPERGYRWGRFQGWSSLVFGVVLFLAAPWIGHEFVFRLATYATGALHMVLGFGLLYKQRKGFILFYVTIALIVHSMFRIPSHPEVYVIVGGWWIIPGIFYYPKRYREFGFGRRAEGAQTAEPQVNNSEPLMRRELTDEEKLTVLKHLEERHKRWEPKQ